MSRRTIVALLVACAAAQAGCSAGSKPQGPLGPASSALVPAPTPAGPPLEPALTVTVDPAGAAVTSADGALTVVFPPEAVTTPTPFTVTRIANMARGAVGPAFRLGPEGNTFAVPVRLTLRAASLPAGMTIGGVGIETQDAAGFWHRVPSNVDAVAGTVSTSTSHFSDWSLTWQLEPAAADGPITLQQTYVNAGRLAWAPFAANGRAALYFLGDDADDTRYLVTGSLTLVPTSFTIDGAECVATSATVTLPASVAELHKSTPPVFRWGLGASWPLTCTSPDGTVTGRQLPALFDTLSINLTRCAGSYAAAQVVGAQQVAGAYTTDCGAEGLVSASWDLRACLEGVSCVPADCRLGLTQCPGGLQVCADDGPAPDGTPCGADGSRVCAAQACVAP